MAAREPKYVIEIKAADALYSKGIEWEHEREWRIIRNFNDAAQKVGRTNMGEMFCSSRFLLIVSAGL